MFFVQELIAEFIILSVVFACLVIVLLVVFFNRGILPRPLSSALGNTCRFLAKLRSDSIECRKQSLSSSFRISDESPARNGRKDLSQRMRRNNG